MWWQRRQCFRLEQRSGNCGVTSPPSQPPLEQRSLPFDAGIDEHCDGNSSSPRCCRRSCWLAVRRQRKWCSLAAVLLMSSMLQLASSATAVAVASRCSLSRYRRPTGGKCGHPLCLRLLLTSSAKAVAVALDFDAAADEWRNGNGGDAAPVPLPTSSAMVIGSSLTPPAMLLAVRWQRRQCCHRCNTATTQPQWRRSFVVLEAATH